jgi:hypothetical protein
MICIDAVDYSRICISGQASLAVGRDENRFVNCRIWSSVGLLIASVVNRRASPVLDEFTACISRR